MCPNIPIEVSTDRSFIPLRGIPQSALNFVSSLLYLGSTGCCFLPHVPSFFITYKCINKCFSWGKKWNTVPQYILWHCVAFVPPVLSTELSFDAAVEARASPFISQRTNRLIEVTHLPCELRHYQVKATHLASVTCLVGTNLPFAFMLSQGRMAVTYLKVIYLSNRNVSLHPIHLCLWPYCLPVLSTLGYHVSPPWAQLWFSCFWIQELSFHSSSTEHRA